MEQPTEWTSQVRRGVLEFCILALIAREPKYGYEIVTQLGAAPQLAAGEGTIYPLLRRLKKEGLVDTCWVESAAGPPRQYYKLTDQGATWLATMQQEWQELVTAVQRLTTGE